MLPIKENPSLSATAAQCCSALPNFLIVGAPKTGTTSLYHYLQQHPQIFMSPVKEPSFFCSELRPENFPDAFRRRVAQQSNELRSHLRDAKPGAPPPGLITEWDDYQLLFRNVQAERAVGEASVFYLWSASAPGNIRSRIPHAKIIMILRDPAERAFSQYLPLLMAGFIKSSFREHIDQCIRATSREHSSVYPFLEFGLYHQQVKLYLEIFPRNNIRIYWYEEAWRKPMALLADLFEFLGVDSIELDTSKRHYDRRAKYISYVLKRYVLGQRGVMLIPRALRSYLKPLVARLGPYARLAPEDRKFLIDYYRNDIEKLALLTNHDLTAWLTVSRSA
jgi:hypothetical protein